MKQELRLSTLIRHGAERTKRVEGTYVEFDGGHWKACTWGAAEFSSIRAIHGVVKDEGHVTDNVGRGQNPGDKLYDIATVRIHRTHWPEEVKGKYRREWLGLRSIVTTLNDSFHWPRGLVADWIDTLIDEHGYDLSLTVEVERPISDPKLGLDVDIDDYHPERPAEALEEAVVGDPAIGEPVTA